MDLATFAELRSPAGQVALAAAADLRPTDATVLAVLERLRKHIPPALARAAVETVILRAKARAKFTHADAMYFTREALEQSSGETVSRYRAERFAGDPAVGDFCCGVGGDAIALAGVARVAAIDADPLRLAMAGENLAAYGVRDRVTLLAGDLLDVPLPPVPAAFFDPDRRSGGRRHVAIRDYQPPLDAVRARLPADFPLGVKVAPAVAWAELAGYDAEVEFVSVGGELKECVLWFGPLRTARRRATLLPGRHTLAADAPAPVPPPGPPRAVLYDPDTAVVRAGLVSNLAEQLDAHPLDPDIAYLTGDGLRSSPFVSTYHIEESLPFHLRRLGERLRALGVGHVTVTKRGSAVDPADLVRRLRLSGPDRRVVVLTRVLGRPYALIARPPV
ncbi:MAG TPA: hypothetical protein VGF55_22905 [Gemmataceae bacterium]